MCGVPVSPVAPIVHGSVVPMPWKAPSTSKKLNPRMRVVVLYRDIRTYGEREYLYREARMAGVLFIPYTVDRKPRVSTSGNDLKIEVMDPLLGKEVSMTADLLCLASAIVPYRDETLARMFKVPMNEDGFFVEAHAKLGPSEFATDGVFLCGMNHYPKPLMNPSPRPWQPLPGL